MGVPYYYKATHKLRTLESFLATLREPVTLEQVCFVGDDRGDLEVMRAVGIPCTVADGIPECHDVAVIVTARHGGDHAVREVCDRILEARKGA
jgi:3-deoxy-D-manno-octulosonate 8-phosphate phosphatase (KDO 8-P phosphatase)